jgi:hypothetical protein
MTSDLVEFYTKLVPQCRQLEKKGSYWYLTWTCKATGRPCSARECPVHTYLRDLIKMPEPLQQAAELVVGTPGSTSLLAAGEAASYEELSISTPDLKPTFTSEALPSNIGPQVPSSRSEAGPRISIRDSRKSKSRAHIKEGRVKRAMITFFGEKTKQLQRWGIDLCFSQKARKTSILAFRRGMGVRFYFGQGVSDGDACKCVEAWFENLHMYDPKSFVNASDSPFSVDLVNE